MTNLAAELLILRKRAATWVLLGIWTTLSMLFAYVLPYLTLTGTAEAPGSPAMAAMLPQNLVDTMLAGFPFFGGVFALILGVLAVGSDYTWDTLKTLLVQGPSRLRILVAKLGGVAVILTTFVGVVFATGALASTLVARAEGAAISWPPVTDVATGLVVGWCIFVVWAVFGLLLGVATRGTAMAIGIGVVHALVIEGILSAVASQVSWLAGTVEYFLRANAYSLAAAVGVPTAAFGDNGPGSYFGPFVSATQAAAVLATYTAVFLGLAAWLMHRRDVD